MEPVLTAPILLDESGLIRACNELASQDKDFARILEQHGYPPLWSRKPGFATLLHIILEQQVSLASAKAAFEKLRERLGEVTPAAFLSLSDEELKTCFFSRQKTRYGRALAEAVTSGSLDLERLTLQPDDAVRANLTRLPGIGTWTADIYLMLALHHPDLFPLGDLAAVNALKSLKQLPRDTPREALAELAATYRPYRSVATFLLWHFYLCERAKPREGFNPRGDNILAEINPYSTLYRTNATCFPSGDQLGTLIVPCPPKNTSVKS
ncbi:MAG: DNA-3-methyladenine glycosylase 2 family protein [Sphingobacteriaceae bacterium]|nr:DNA-3-methyladenine glycosylase 2 family protein [Cytophagaceae bacterium]